MADKIQFQKGEALLYVEKTVEGNIAIEISFEKENHTLQNTISVTKAEAAQLITLLQTLIK